jgi:site-specific DNA-methyltransferase (adenine-specific)
MSTSKTLKQSTIYHKSCYGLTEISDNSIDALITDPPYGISFQSHYWDKDLPDPRIWKDSLRVLKPGAFGLVFSSIRLLHRLMVDLEDQGFMIKDVLLWAYLNGMPKSRNVALGIDRELGVDSKIVGEYNYVQGYKKGGASSYTVNESKYKLEPVSPLALQYKGAGLALKPAYEPIVLIQKPIEQRFSVAQNIIRYGTGALNLEDSRIPYESGETKVGHNPHPKGRVPANILRTEDFGDGYDKFFLVPKVRQHKDDFNLHPTIKPVELMQHLVKLTSFEDQIVLDPFTGSGSTALACLQLRRDFTGYELDKHYVAIAQKRISQFYNKPQVPTTLEDTVVYAHNNATQVPLFG